MHQGGQPDRPAADRVLFGGRVVSSALVTWVLVGLNVAFYLVEWVYPKIEDYWAMVGRVYDPALNQVIGVAAGQ